MTRQKYFHCISHRDIIGMSIIFIVVKSLPKPGEFPVLQYQHPAIDLPYSQLAGARLLRRRHQQVHHGRSSSSRDRPGLLYGRPQLLVSLVHLLHAPHEDLQVDPDQGEQRRLEVDLPLLIHRHVHPDQPLVSQQIRALGAKAQGRIDLSQQREEVSVVNQAPEIRERDERRARPDRNKTFIQTEGK